MINNLEPAKPGSLREKFYNIAKNQEMKLRAKSKAKKEGIKNYGPGESPNYK